MGDSTSYDACMTKHVTKASNASLSNATDNPDKEPSWVESVLIGKGSNLALAMLCSKFFVPLKLPAAVALTPYVHRWQDRVWKAWVDRGAKKTGF